MNPTDFRHEVEALLDKYGARVHRLRKILVDGKPVLVVEFIAQRAQYEAFEAEVLETGYSFYLYHYEHWTSREMLGQEYFYTIAIAPPGAFTFVS